MEAVPVHVGVMDSQRPGTVVTLQVDSLSAARRLGRAALRGLMVSGVGLGVTLLPLLHACGLFTVLLVGPLVAAFSLRASVLLAEGEVACPRCAAPVGISAKLAGWPARVHCGSCGAMVELKPAPAEKPA